MYLDPGNPVNRIALPVLRTGRGPADGNSCSRSHLPDRRYCICVSKSWQSVARMSCGRQQQKEVVDISQCGKRARRRQVAELCRRQLRRHTRLSAVHLVKQRFKHQTDNGLSDFITRILFLNAFTFSILSRNLSP